MATTTLIHGDAADYALAADIMLTDPPFDMPGAEVARIINRYEVNHLLLLTTVRQIISFMQQEHGWKIRFDFVMDGVVPRGSKSTQQPYYIHNLGIYLTRNGAKSLFSRKRRQRSDVFEGNGYWPTIFYAPRTAIREHGHAKNEAAITDILGSFDVQSVIDPFAGNGTTALAAYELKHIKHCTLIERDPSIFHNTQKRLQFLSATGLDIIESQSHATL